MSETRQTPERKLIVFDGGHWFVRRVFSITHDLNEDHKVYRCDAPISGPHATLADVPEVRAAISRATEE